MLPPRGRGDGDEFGSDLSIVNLESRVVCRGTLVSMLQFPSFKGDVVEGIKGEYWACLCANIVVDGSGMLPCWCC